MRQRQQQTTADACIWMQADVVKSKQCNRDYACNGCRFDRILRQLAEENRQKAAAGTPAGGRRGRIVHWADRLRRWPARQQPCLHHMKQRIDFRACTNDYLCSNCEFDQYFQDQFAVHAVLQPVDMQQVQGIRLPQGIYLHRGHTWVDLAAGGQVRIGLDAFAARLLGPMEAIDLPLMGKTVGRDTPGIGLRRGELDARLLSPVSGVVTAFNPEARTHPESVAADPYGDGWLLMVQPTHLRDDLRHLQMGNEATGFIESEMESLYDALEFELGPLATDGGQLADDIFGKLPTDCWGRMARQFLRS